MQAVADGTARIAIRGVIGWDVWADQLAAMLDGLDRETVTRVEFEIYSPGGFVDEGNYLAAKIAELPMDTHAYVYRAASMATIIALACKGVTMASNGRWLVHNPWSMIIGDASTAEKAAKELRDTENEAANLYAVRTGKSAADMLALMNEERWMTATEALEWGFINDISDPFSQAEYADVSREVAQLMLFAGDAAAPADPPESGEKGRTEEGEPEPEPDPVSLTPADVEAAYDEGHDAGSEEATAAVRAEVAEQIAAATAELAELREENADILTAYDALDSEAAEAAAAQAAEIERLQGVAARLTGGGLGGTDEDEDQKGGVDPAVEAKARNATTEKRARYAGTLKLPARRAR